MTPKFSKTTVFEKKKKETSILLFPLHLYCLLCLLFRIFTVFLESHRIC